MHTSPLSLFHIIRPSSLKDVSPPVLFMFHGYGSNEEDLFSFANELPSEYFIISVRAPYSLPPFGNAWYSINFDAEYGKWSDDKEALLSIDKILLFLEEACTAYNLDKTKVDLLGFSQGTILCYAIALSYPEKIRNMIGLSGYINENLLSGTNSIKDYSKLAIYASHGQVDQVIPIEWAQKSVGLLNKLKVDLTYKEFPIGHGVSPENFYSFQTWLKKRI
ncbi:alpha/beta hydrolase [Eudoraea chungangensis]|uniref:alpha/beta hydrolase n=1 Tax=Eudoraea chungangensis TaxID=1481905 RepID=UPI0023ECDB6F|nr:phospholipase [Eudoraea chungangensis]